MKAPANISIKLATLLLHKAPNIEGHFLAGGVKLDANRDIASVTYRSMVNNPGLGGQGPGRELFGVNRAKFTSLVDTALRENASPSTSTLINNLETLKLS